MYEDSIISCPSQEINHNERIDKIEAINNNNNIFALPFGNKTTPLITKMLYTDNDFYVLVA